MYNIGKLSNDGYILPQAVRPMRLLEALDYIDEYYKNYFNKFGFNSEEFSILVPIREDRWDALYTVARSFKHDIGFDTDKLRVDMLMHWDEYWDDWEYYDKHHRTSYGTYTRVF